jgi:hypothetical protein
MVRQLIGGFLGFLDQFDQTDRDIPERTPKLTENLDIF